jgi:uncharacterized protein Usg
MSNDLLIFPREKVLTTAEILYHLPDYPELLQTYIWQELDLMPKFPFLHQFLTFWTKNLDGKLHSVIVATHSFYEPHDYTFALTELNIH